MVFHEDAQCQEKRHILVLHSYNKGLEWTDSEDEGIMSVLQPRRGELEVHTEYMDTKRLAGNGEFSDFLVFLVKKYASVRFSSVICTDDDAFNFVFRHRGTFFQDVPIVFCGVNYLDETLAAENRQVFTGVMEAFDIGTTLKTALLLHPQAKKIAVINDRTTTGRANRKILDSLLPEFAGKTEIEFLEDLTMAELQATVGNLPSTSIILLMTFNRDSNDEAFDYNESIELISHAAKVPIYGVWDFYLGKGIVGGMLTSGWDQGRTAAEIALRIIGGERLENIPVITRSPNRFMFDHRQLKRFGIDAGDLPRGSLIINEPVTFMDIHGGIIRGAVIVVAGLLVVIVLLLARMAERRRSAEEMGRAHRQTATILESITDGFIAVDGDLRFTYVNREAERMLGQNRDALIGRSHQEVFPDMTEVEDFYRQVMARGIGGDLQYWHEGPGVGTGRWLAVKAYPAEGGGISAYLRDSTREKAINDERIRLATAIEQAAEAIFITDTRWIVQYINPAFERMTGYSRDEILGRHIRLLQSGVHAPDFYRQIRETLMAGRVWSGQIFSRKKDGTVYPTEATDSPVRDGSGTIINFVGVSRDITVEMRLERELRQAQKMEAIGTLAGGIAHDFNNILAIILGFTEIAIMKLPGSGPARDNLQRVKDAATRATDLVRQILAFSRKTEHQKIPMDFAEFIKEALRLMRPLLPTTIEIVSRAAPSARPLIVSMDLTEMHQVVMNLCTNAAHAMGPGGGVLGIEVSEIVVGAELASRHLELQPGSYVCLAVSDTGSGIPVELLERIFDPYFTTKEAGVGTGLGLSVVRGIVKGHGGMISVHSQPHRGTTFKVFLPRMEGLEGVTEPAVESFPPGSERVLFVDDEETLAQLGVEILEPSGYKVTVKTGGPEALAAFRAEPQAFDLVITDMTMPQLTGKELAAEIKAIRKDIPIILCTGFSELVNERSAREAGVDEFLMKPYTVIDLLRKIRAVMQN